MIVCAVLFMAGGALSLLTIRSRLETQLSAVSETQSSRRPNTLTHCGVGAPPLAGLVPDGQ